MTAPLPERKRTRLPGYDYSRAGVYFLTLCAAERRCLFAQVCAGGGANQSIPAFVSALKRMTNRVCGVPLWQRGYHDHVLRNEADCLRIWNYIDTNPAKWAEDKYFIP